jgi:putative membrane protein
VDTERSAPVGVGYPAALLAAFLVVFVALGIAPSFRQDWLLENLIVVVAIGLMILTRHRLRFSNRAYTLVFVFLVLHEIGAHYTYSLVPYDEWMTRGFGVSISEGLGLNRNHYDRLIHLAYGLLVLPAAVELLEYVSSPRGIWRLLLPMLFILSHSALYELIEWGAALVFGGELGVAYVGTQGDEWDAQKDMASAAAGAVLSQFVLSSAAILRKQAPDRSVSVGSRC